MRQCIIVALDIQLSIVALCLAWQLTDAT